jgi:hypothetical protein
MATRSFAVGVVGDDFLAGVGIEDGLGDERHCSVDLGQLEVAPGAEALGGDDFLLVVVVARGS